MRALRRHPSVLAVDIALGLILLATVVGIVWFWPPTPTTTSDYLAAEGLILAGGTFLLAVVGAGVAAYAYAQSIRRPHLDVKVMIVFDSPTNPETGERAPQRGVQATLRADNQPPLGTWELPPARLSINLLNDGELTARNVTVSVGISGIQTGLDGYVALPRGWTIVEISVDDSRVQLQWDGGADLAVHPGVIQSRNIDLRFLMSFAQPGDAVWARATAFADGAEPVDGTFWLPIVAPPEPEQAPTPEVHD